MMISKCPPMRSAAMLAMGLFVVCGGASADQKPGSREGGQNQKMPESRPFLMGFATGTLGGPEVRARADKIAVDHTDMAVLHVKVKIPWAEASAGNPYPDDVEEQIALQKSRLPRDRKTYLAVSPITKGRTNCSWAGKEFDDPLVITAFINHCRRMIREFKPDYFAYGVEVNMLAITNPKAFQKYLVMLKEVYRVLKRENPKLPVFLTFQIDFYHVLVEKQRQAILQLLPYTDYLAVSSYPYMKSFNQDNLPRDWFSQVAELAPGKPFAIAETGYAAQDVVMRKGAPRVRKDVHRSGSEEAQTWYTRFVLEESQRLNATFVVWFFAQDFDAHIEQAEKNGERKLESAKIWQHSGMVDRDGRNRTSLQVWDEWFRLNLQDLPER